MNEQALMGVDKGKDNTFLVYYIEYNIQYKMFYNYCFCIAVVLYYFGVLLVRLCLLNSLLRSQ